MQSSRSIACLLARFDTPRLKALLEERADGATLIDSLLNRLKDFTGERWEQKELHVYVTYHESRCPLLLINMYLTLYLTLRG